MMRSSIQAIEVNFSRHRRELREHLAPSFWPSFIVTLSETRDLARNGALFSVYPMLIPRRPLDGVVAARPKLTHPPTQTNHDTRYHNDFQAYVKGRAAEQAQAQAQAAAAHGLPPPQYSAPRLQAIPFQPPITLQPQVSAAPGPAFVPTAVPVRTSSSNFSMSGSAFDLSAGASLWTPADAAAPAPSLLEPRDVVPGTFGIEAGALGPPPPARSLSASYPAQSPPFSPAPTPPRSPTFAPVCPPPPRAPSPAPSPLALDGLSLGGRPPGLDARSRAPSESTLQTELSESLSDALR